MAYADFTLSGLTKQFNLRIEERTDLFKDVPEATLRGPFQAQLEKTAPLALKVSTEKARSEFIIAPILAELWLLTDQQVGLFSGVDFTIDPAQGLAGVCDYIVTRSPEQYFIQAPVLMLVEAKNEDMKRGYAQCLAEMLGAQAFKVREGVEGDKTYGAVTTGSIWKFLEEVSGARRDNGADRCSRLLHRARRQDYGHPVALDVSGRAVREPGVTATN
jgi:hypothetical protein